METLNLPDAAVSFFEAGKAIQAEVNQRLGPPEEGLASRHQHVVQTSFVRGTRGYIERVVNQANGAYENGWYDACAVMIRRLVETLIIEVYEKNGLAHKIKNQPGDFLFLRDLIDACILESTWALSRDCKRALPKLKDIGDKSAHSRRYNAHRSDIDKVLNDIRTVIQELCSLAGLK